MSVTVRSASSTRIQWIGVLLAVFGLFTAVYAVVPVIRGDIVLALLPGAGGALLLLLGIVLVALARRSAARLDPSGISFSTMLGSRTVVPWQQVQQVHVPGRGDPGDAVALVLRDGSVVAVSPLRKAQGADSGTHLDPRYLRAGQQVAAAHRQWWETWHRTNPGR